MKTSEKKGYVLYITMIVIFVISLIALTTFTVAYRYEATIHQRLEDLREYVLQ